jgi:hypothetical protein
MDRELELLNLALRTDPVSFIQRSFLTVVPHQTFVPGWHIEIIGHTLKQVMLGNITRLLITLPPRNLKSHCCSVAFPALVLGHDPSARIICASYGIDLALKFGRDSRAIMNSDWYRAAFPRSRLDPSKASEQEMMTLQRGYRLATSVGGGLTGRGGNYLIIDDPMKAGDAMSATHRASVIEWLSNTALSRLDDKRTGRVVIVMQRLHTDDLVGYLLDSNSDWMHLNFPAISDRPQWFDLGDGRLVGRDAGEALHPKREPLDALEQLRRTLGSHTYEAQYQQNPLPLEGGLIKWSWFMTYRQPPNPQPDDLIAQSWDTASKGSEAV